MNTEKIEKYLTHTYRWILSATLLLHYMFVEVDFYGHKLTRTLTI